MSELDKISAEQPSPSGVGTRSVLWKIPALLFHRYSLALLVALALGLLLYMTLSENGFIKTQNLREEREKLLSEIERLEDENRILGERLERLKSDPAYVEDEVRRKLGYVRPDEEVYRLSEEPDLGELPPPPPQH